MKKMNKKGFTLIELLAVIIILGVLLLIAVPSVSKYIQNSRMNTYETNLSKLVDAVSTEVNSYSSNYTFSTDEFLVVPLHCIDVERGSNTESPFGPYIKNQSFIIVTRKTETQSSGAVVPVGFKYYVAAVDTNGYGTNLKVAEEVAVTAAPTAVTITKGSDDEYTISSTSEITEITENMTGKLVGNCILTSE